VLVLGQQLGVFLLIFFGINTSSPTVNQLAEPLLGLAEFDKFFSVLTIE